MHNIELGRLVEGLRMARIRGTVVSGRIRLDVTED